jgi:hypothetical protein
MTLGSMRSLLGGDGIDTLVVSDGVDLTRLDAGYDNLLR